MKLPRTLRERWAPADPSTLGARGGRLTPCPARPNCVSSSADRARQRVDPLPLGDDPDAAWENARAVLRSWPRTKIVEERKGEYLRAECRTLLGFVDDLELLAVADDGVIHVRSGSRLGYRDFEVNRKRVERLRREMGERGERAKGPEQARGPRDRGWRDRGTTGEQGKGRKGQSGAQG